MVSLAVIDSILLLYLGLNVLAGFDTPSGMNFSGPVCLEDVLIFECSVTGTGATVWRGSVFNCESKSNEISLLHSRFNTNISTISSCNDGAVVGQILYVDHDQYYTSQLNVTINFALIERDIICAYDDGVISHRVGCHTLNGSDFSCSNYSNHTGPGTR